MTTSHVIAHSVYLLFMMGLSLGCLWVGNRIATALEPWTVPAGLLLAHRYCRLVDHRVREAPCRKCGSAPGAECLVDVLARRPSRCPTHGVWLESDGSCDACPRS